MAMSAYVSLETHERHAFIESTINEALESLTQPEVRSALGPNTDTHASVIANMQIANIHNGFVTASGNTTDNDKVPIFAVRDGETLKLATSLAGLSIPQEQAASRFIRRCFGSEVEIDACIETVNELLTTSDLPSTEARLAVPNVLGFIMRSHGILYDQCRDGSTLAALFRGRPVVALVMRKGLPQIVSNVGLIHETQHVIQAQHRPVIYAPNALALSKKRQQNRYSDELKAYQIGAYYASALAEVDARFDEADELIAPQGQVETLREQHTSPRRPYIATKRLIKALHAAKLDIAR